MIRIPEDLMKELTDKYPDANIRHIVQLLFDNILEKTLKDGSCMITEFGKFESFKTFSTKLQTEVIRFKFRISPVLEKKIKFDKYLLDNAPVKAKVPFTEVNLEKCNQEIRESNITASTEAGRLGSLRSKEKKMSQIVQDLLDN